MFMAAKTHLHFSEFFVHTNLPYGSSGRDVEVTLGGVGDPPQDAASGRGDFRYSTRLRGIFQGSIPMTS
jgi:hypothetical protein